jgi:hypothetical protein
MVAHALPPRGAIHTHLREVHVLCSRQRTTTQAIADVRSPQLLLLTRKGRAVHGALEVHNIVQHGRYRIVVAYKLPIMLCGYADRPLFVYKGAAK